MIPINWRVHEDDVTEGGDRDGDKPYLRYHCKVIFCYNGVNTSISLVLQLQRRFRKQGYENDLKFCFFLLKTSLIILNSILSFQECSDRVTTFWRAIFCISRELDHGEMDQAHDSNQYCSTSECKYSDSPKVMLPSP